MGAGKSYAIRAKNETKEYYHDGRIKNKRFKTNRLVVGVMAKILLLLVVVSL